MVIYLCMCFFLSWQWMSFSFFLCCGMMIKFNTTAFQCTTDCTSYVLLGGEHSHRLVWTWYSGSSKERNREERSISHPNVGENRLEKGLHTRWDTACSLNTECCPLSSSTGFYFISYQAYFDFDSLISSICVLPYNIFLICMIFNLVCLPLYNCLLL